MLPTSSFVTFLNERPSNALLREDDWTPFPDQGLGDYTPLTACPPAIGDTVTVEDLATSASGEQPRADLDWRRHRHRPFVARQRGPATGRRAMTS